MKTARRIGRHCRLVVVVVAAACLDMDLGHKASAHLIKRSMAGLAAVCYLSPASTPPSQTASQPRQVKCQIRHGSTTTAATTTETALGAARNLSLNRPRHKVVKRLIEVSLFKRETHLQPQLQPELRLRLHLQIETSV